MFIIVTGSNKTGTGRTCININKIACIDDMILPDENFPGCKSIIYIADRDLKVYSTESAEEILSKIYIIKPQEKLTRFERLQDE